MGLVQQIGLLTQHARRITSTVTANFFAGTATSGLLGADLFTYGGANQWWILTEAYLRLFPGVWGGAADITIRAYLNLMGSETMVMDEDWSTDGSDGDIALIYWFWESEIFGPLRIEVQSADPADVAVTVPYEFRVKDW